jgi:hypothetical protein
MKSLGKVPGITDFLRVMADTNWEVSRLAKCRNSLEAWLIDEKVPKCDGLRMHMFKVRRVIICSARQRDHKTKEKIRKVSNCHSLIFREQDVLDQISIIKSIPLARLQLSNPSQMHIAAISSFYRMSDIRTRFIRLWNKTEMRWWEFFFDFWEELG